MTLALWLRRALLALALVSVAALATETAIAQQPMPGVPAPPPTALTHADGSVPAMVAYVAISLAATVFGTLVKVIHYLWTDREKQLLDAHAERAAIRDNYEKVLEITRANLTTEIHARRVSEGELHDKQQKVFEETFVVAQSLGEAQREVATCLKDLAERVRSLEEAISHGRS